VLKKLYIIRYKSLTGPELFPYKETYIMHSPDSTQEEIQHEAELDGEAGQPAKQENGPVIVVEDLTKAFGGKKILDGLSVQVDAKENLVVMGKSGTGKSVLIKCIVQLIQPDSGKIEVLGHDMAKVSGRELDEMRLRIGFLFQSGALYDSMTVRENMAFPLVRQKRSLGKAEVNKAVEDVLESVGLSHAIDKWPAELSGGMRKRAGLARTLILRPEIVLYDEPTTGLDTATSKEISELINSVRDEYNVASIIITHDLPCAKTCGDSIMILKEGKNYAQGTYEAHDTSDDPFIQSLFH
jgi:phospholipid/cholesterol/gamma-HCH transport system ATP-binding protein